MPDLDCFNGDVEQPVFITFGCRPPLRMRRHLTSGFAGISSKNESFANWEINKLHYELWYKLKCVVFFKQIVFCQLLMVNELK